MTKEEARKLQQVLELAGLPGEAGPLDLAAPEREWRIWDWADGDERRDVTVASLDSLVARMGGSPRRPAQPVGPHAGRRVVLPE